MKKALLFLLSLPLLFYVNGQYVTNGTAVSTGNNCFRLTQALQGQGGSVWFQNKISLASDFTVDATVYLGNIDANGADGLAFVLQPVCNGLGSAGGGLGYLGITPSLAVELDTWYNQEIIGGTSVNDPVEDHIGLMANGVINHNNVDASTLQGFNTLANIEDGNDHTLKIEWIASTQNLKVTLDGTLQINYTGDIVTTIFGGNRNVYWGFTAATGGAINEQRVCINSSSFTEEGSFTVTKPTCPNFNDGAIDLNPAGGVGPFTYEWSNGETTEDLTGISEGTYSVTVTDGNGCKSAFSILVMSEVDNTPPVVLTKNISIPLVNGTATITAADVTKESQWIGYINAYFLPSEGGNLAYTGVEQVADLKSTIDANAGTVTLQPNFSKYNSNDPYWSNGAIGNKIVQSSTYVEETALKDQFFTFTGYVVSNTLATGYDNYAWVRIFDQNFGLLYEVRDPLVQGQNFKVKYDFTPANTVYVQYGFTIQGLNANPADEAALGSVVVNAVTKLEDACGPTFSSIDVSSFDCSNIGPNTVTLTVTDVNGNSNSATAVVTVLGELPTCSIASIPSGNTFTGGVSTNLYLGYGAQSTTLQVSAPASGAPYTYAWSGGTLSNYNTADPVFTATTAGTFTFTVEVTNKYGCKTTCSITICVMDIRVPGTNGKKVYVCHIPAGNPGNPQTLSISVNAVPAHIGLHGGDRLGTCDMQPCTAPSIVSQKSAVTVEDAHEGLKVTVAPNPTNTHFTFRLQSQNETPVSIRIVNGTGQVLESANKVNANGTIQMGGQLINGLYFAEFMQGADRQVIKVMKIGSR